MMKILREIIIILLLCAAILLILGILFYDYNPVNKVVPNKVAYEVPENVKEDLQVENIDNTTPTIENKVYTVDDVDLNIYRKSQTYNPSKENPFSTTSADDSTETSTSSGTTVVDKDTTTTTTTTTTETKPKTMTETETTTQKTNTTTVPKGIK